MLVLVSSVSHSAVKYTGFREDLTTYSKPYLLTCFSRGKDEFASHHPQPHLDLLAANDTFARLSASPGWKHSTQVEVLVSLILERKWPECEWGRSPRGAQQKFVKGPEQLLLSSWVSPSLSSWLPGAQLRKHLPYFHQESENSASVY